MDLFKAYEIPQSKTGRLQLGPLNLWITNLEDEWKLSWLYSMDPIDSSLSELKIENELPTIIGGIERRFGFKEKSNIIYLTPQLSDRSMVVRPDTPLLIPAQEKVGFHLSTSLWVNISDGGREKYLTELPAFRPSDTWFGESTSDGELCYVTKTAARLRVEQLPARKHRAITSINIHNLGIEPLLVDRIKVPMKNLSLYRNEAGFYHTESLDYEWNGNESMIKMVFKGKPHFLNMNLTLVSEPRIKLPGNLVVRTFRSLFNSSKEE